MYRFVLSILIALMPAGPAMQTLAGEAQAGAQSASVPVPNRLSLQELIKEALAKNPAIQSAQRSVEASKHRIPQAKALPDPTLSVGWSGNIAPFSVQSGNPASFRTVTASQALLLPAKRSLRGQIAAKETQETRWDYEVVRRRVVAEVKAAYYEYAFYSKAVDITTRNKGLLQKLSNIATVRYQVGKGIQQDVLRSQVEVASILQTLTTLDQQKRVAQTRINTLLLRDPDYELPPPAEIQKVSLGRSLNDLYQLAEANDPELRRAESTIQRNKLAVNFARKEYYPDLSVAYQYQQVPLMKDMQGLAFTVNIPVFYRSKQREALRENTENLASAQYSRDNRRTTLYFELKEQYLSATASEQLLNLYSQAIVPQSSLTLESSMASYQVGAVDFLNVITNFRNVLDYEVNYYRELANYHIAVARIEPLIGVELIP